MGQKREAPRRAGGRAHRTPSSVLRHPLLTLLSALRATYHGKEHSAAGRASTLSSSAMTGQSHCVAPERVGPAQDDSRD